MPNYQYKVVPFIGKAKSSSTAGDISNQLQTLINEQAGQGWEFYQLNDVSIEVSPGCLGGLLGAKVSYVTYDQLIFRKES